MSALIIDIILWCSVAMLAVIAWQRGRPVMTASVREGTMDFINIVPRIALGVIGSGYIAAVIPAEIITGWLGPNSGWLGVLTAVIAGAATPGGPVVGFSIGAVALKNGGGARRRFLPMWSRGRCSPFSVCCCGKFLSCRRDSSGFEPRCRCHSRFWRQPSQWQLEGHRVGGVSVDTRNVII